MLLTNRRAVWSLALLCVIGYELVVEAVTALVPILGNAILVLLGLRFIASSVRRGRRDE